MKNPMDEILRKIEAYCKRKGVTETRFGRQVSNSPSLVSRMRSGVYSGIVVTKVLKYLEDHK